MTSEIANRLSAISHAEVKLHKFACKMKRLAKACESNPDKGGKPTPGPCPKKKPESRLKKVARVAGGVALAVPAAGLGIAKGVARGFISSLGHTVKATAEPIAHIVSAPIVDATMGYAVGSGNRKLRHTAKVANKALSNAAWSGGWHPDITHTDEYKKAKAAANRPPRRPK
jgi:hypothetical protein